jgi:hypothetical protein
MERQQNNNFLENQNKQKKLKCHVDFHVNSYIISTANVLITKVSNTLAYYGSASLT